MSRACHEKSINILENEQFRCDINAKASAIATPTPMPGQTACSLIKTLATTLNHAVIFNFHSNCNRQRETRPLFMPE